MKEGIRQRLHELARSLVHPERYGDAALKDTVEFDPVRPVDYPHRVDDPTNVIPVDFTAPPDEVA